VESQQFAAVGAVSGQDALLATKLHVPRLRPGFVPRPRLAEALGEGLARGRVLVCAPAGSGKTALLADLAGDSDRPVAWLGLDDGDSDPVRFWRYVIAALDRARPGLAGRAGPLLGPPPPGSFEGLVTALVNELAADPGQDDVLLILDDYHLVDSGQVHDSVAFLLENLPRNLRVVISGRADPPLPLARLRARGQLAELRAADLRFTRAEAAALLGKAAGHDVPAAAADELTDRTEGWAAGLQLAGLSLRGRADAAGFASAFSGSHRFVLDYLADEVLAGQSEQVRTFLLETSVLERLSGQLCDAVTGRAGSQAMLEDIERAGLFLVPLDEVRGWWRYHHLFAGLLRVRLQAEQPGQVQVLHRAAAAWYEAHDLADDAVRHALAAEDTGLAARLVERNVEMLLGRSEGATLRRWLSALPAESLRDRPRLYLAQAYGAALGYRVAALATLLDEADRAFAVSGEQPWDDPDGSATSVLANVPAATALLRAVLARLRGDAALAADYNRKAQERLGQDEWLMRSFVRWNQAMADRAAGRLEQAERGLTEVLTQRRAAGLAGFLFMHVCYSLGEVQREQGDLDGALAAYRQALEVVGPETANAGMAHVGLAQILYERNELTAALDYATRGVALCRQIAYTTPLATGLAMVARIRHAQGDAAGAREAIGQAGQIELSEEVAALLDLQRVRLLLAQGDVSAAVTWAQSTDLRPDDELDYPREPQYLMLARMLLARHDHDAALSLLQRLLEAAAGQGRTGSVIEIQVLRSLTLQARGDHPGALEALTEAVTLARGRGYVRVFADEGAAMHALLTRVSGEVDHLDVLIRACVPPPRKPAAAVPPGMYEPLTDRELEVLLLLAAGKSNQRIAHDLVVALDTVKKHVTHLLGKLGAANRTEAVARARHLGLIP
jgi:LuxR family maltose regulon positive regulatory protein